MLAHHDVAKNSLTVNQSQSNHFDQPGRRFRRIAMRAIVAVRTQHSAIDANATQIDLMNRIKMDERMNE